MNRHSFCYKVRVKNLTTSIVYLHNKIPFEHVEMLKLNPNLEIEILGRYREYYNEEDEVLQEIDISS